MWRRTHTTSLRERYQYSEFFWSIFYRIRTEYGEILRISPYLVRMRENTGQKNSKDGHFSRSVYIHAIHQYSHKVSASMNQRQPAFLKRDSDTGVFL